MKTLLISMAFVYALSLAIILPAFSQNAVPASKEVQDYFASELKYPLWKYASESMPQAAVNSEYKRFQVWTAPGTGYMVVATFVAYNHVAYNDVDVTLTFNEKFQIVNHSVSAGINAQYFPGVVK